jgi:serine protease Do
MRYTKSKTGRGFTPSKRKVVIIGALWFLFANSLFAQSMDTLHQFSSTLETLVRKVSPSVVQVLVSGYGAFGDPGQTAAVIGKQRSLGSGFVIDPDGYIMTNAHVVKGAQRVQVVVQQPGPELSPIHALNVRGRTMEARILGISEELDLALLKVEAHGLPALRLGNYDQLRQGQVVLAFGNPEGLQNSVSMGLVSSVARQPDPDNAMIFIQTDASINPGNSGGPLLDIDGNVVGISTFIVSQSGGNEGLGFAIPSAIVRFAYPQLRKFGHVHGGEIGIYVQAVTPNLAGGLHLSADSGVIIADVLPGSSAEKAGLKVQDLVMAVDGRPTESVPLFTFAMFTRAPGEKVKLDIMRGSKKMQFQVATMERPHKADQLADLADPEKNTVAKLGIIGIEIDDKVAQMLPSLRESSGVIVAARAAGLPDAPLITGDVIHAVNGSPITSINGLRSGLDLVKPGDPVVLQVERDGGLMFVTMLLE